MVKGCHWTNLYWRWSKRIPLMGQDKKQGKPWKVKDSLFKKSYFSVTNKLILLKQIFGPLNASGNSLPFSSLQTLLKSQGLAFLIKTQWKVSLKEAYKKFPIFFWIFMMEIYRLFIAQWKLIKCSLKILEFCESNIIIFYMHRRRLNMTSTGTMSVDQSTFNQSLFNSFRLLINSGFGSIWNESIKITF